MPTIGNHRWFVEPLSEKTNTVLAGELPAENAHFGIRDIDGVQRNLWECSRRFITMLKRHARERELTFRVFLEESSGDIVPWGPREPRLKRVVTNGCSKETI